MTTSDGLLPDELRYFQEVARLGSVSAAARELRVNASAVSRQIAKLERSLGVQLFLRRSRGVSLTAQGYRLLAHVRRAGVEAQELLSDLSREGTVARRFRVACSDGFAVPVVARATAELCSRRPGVRVDVMTDSSDNVVRMVREERADIGACFVTGLSPGVRVEYTFPVAMYAVMAVGHPAASAPQMTMEEALAYPYGLLRGRSTQRDLLTSAAGKRGIVLDPVFECERSPVLIDFARAGGGLVFVSPLGGRLRADEELRFVPVVDAELGQRSGQIHTPLGHELDAVQSEFLGLLVAQLQSGIPDGGNAVAGDDPRSTQAVEARARSHVGDRTPHTR